MKRVGDETLTDVASGTVPGESSEPEAPIVPREEVIAVGAILHLYTTYGGF